MEWMARLAVGSQEIRGVRRRLGEGCRGSLSLGASTAQSRLTMGLSLQKKKPPAFTGGPMLKSLLSRIPRLRLGVRRGALHALHVGC
jgi:hypothetical protein